MHKFRPVFSTRLSRFCVAFGTLSGIAALGLGGQTAWADSTCTPPNNGPTGPSAVTFTYQCDGIYAGDWTNAYYIYDPTTGTQTALYSPDYTYDCTTGTWTQAEWDYDAASGAYIENRVAAAAPPDQPTNCATTDSNSSTESAADTGSASSDPTTSDNTPSTDPDASSTDPTDTTSNTPTPSNGPEDSTESCPTPYVPSSSTADPSDGGTTTVNNGTTLNNTDCSQSQSGDATVTNNGSAGNATSGDATTEVDVANLVQSLSNALGGDTATFTTNVDGNVNGDLVLDPSTILAGASGSSSSDGQPGGNVSDVNNNAAINNIITATATTGNATVSGNGDGGNATTGNAETIVNLINMINSDVAAGQSFIGTININGDLDGNILIPQSVIDELMGTNASGTNSGGTNTTDNNNESIDNNVTTDATSGNATVADNYNGGNATSGNADTNVTLLNLTGNSIVGQNVLLVFVNVLGQWVGMIVNAPTGATSAEYGGGITSDTPSTGSGVVEADANLNITNNVVADATSGNATVADNYSGGNATSGNADTAVNILNVEDSTLSLANWFGVLFINVFGVWNGNFGILPTPVSVSGASDTSSAQDTTPTVAQYKTPYRHFATFVSSDTGTDPTSGTSAVLGDATIVPATHKFTPSVLTTSSKEDSDSYVLTLVGLFVALMLLAGAERGRFVRNKKSS